MSHTYNPSAPSASWIAPLALTVPDSGDARTAAAQNTPDQQLGDMLERVRRVNSASIRAMMGNWSAALDTTNRIGYLGDFTVNYQAGAANPPAFTAPTSGYNAPSLLMYAGNSAYTQIAGTMSTGGPSLFLYATWLLATFEVEIAMGNVGANNMTVTAGICNNANVTNFCGSVFQKASTDTNWQCKTNDGATTSTTDSGVAPSASTFQRLRVDIYGSGLSGGIKSVFSINGTTVATKTTNNYTGANTLSGIASTLGTAATGNSIQVGRISTEWTLRSGY